VDLIFEVHLSLMFKAILLGLVKLEQPISVAAS